MFLFLVLRKILLQLVASIHAKGTVTGHALDVVIKAHAKVAASIHQGVCATPVLTDVWVQQKVLKSYIQTLFQNNKFQIR